MTIKKARRLRDTLFIAGFVITILGYLWTAFFIIGIIVMLSGLIPHFLYNKCPRCRKQLGRNEGKFCQFCGQPLDD